MFICIFKNVELTSMTPFYSGVDIMLEESPDIKDDHPHDVCFPML